MYKIYINFAFCLDIKTFTVVNLVHLPVTLEPGGGGGGITI